MLKRSLLAAVLLSLTAAAPAAATDRIVKPSGTNNASCSAATPCQTVTQGVTAAVSGDRVVISPGLYAEAVVVNKRIALVGAGAGSPTAAPSPVIHTIIQPATAGTALRMSQGGSASGLRLLGRAGTASAGNGLDLRAAASAAAGPGAAFAYAVSGVVAEASVNASTVQAEDQDAPGARFSALDAGAGSVLPVTVEAVDSHFVGHGASPGSGQSANGAPGLQVDGPTNAPRVDVTVRRSTARGAEFGAGQALQMVNGTADPSRTRLTLDQVTVPLAAHGTGVSINAGSTVDVSRSHVIGLTTGVAVQSFAPVDLTVRDSLLEREDGSQSSSGAHTALGLTDADSTDYRVHLFGSTLVAEEDNPARTDTAAMGVELGDADDKAAVDVHNSVLRGFGAVTNGLRYDTVAGAAAAATAERSSVGTVVGTGATATFAATGAVTGNPLFTDEAGANFVPRADSPLIDAGTTSVLQGGELDLAGQPRSLDSNFDCVAAPEVGAYEIAGRAGAAPAVSATASKARVEAGTRVDFTATASDPDGLASTAWTLPGGAGSGGLTTGAIMRTPGANAVSFRASDPRGCAATATTTVQVDRAVAPSVSAVKLAKRFTAAKGATLAYRLSETAEVSLRFERRTGKGRKRRWTKVADVARPEANAGTVRLKLRKRVARKALVPGSWRVKVVATDLVGLRSRTATKGFVVAKAKPKKRKRG